MGELAVAAVQYRGRLFSEWRFDRRLQIDTRGVVSEKDTVATTTGHRDGTRYEATRPRDFERLAKSLPLDAPPAAYTFIDLGCGKGRVLVLAADHGFGRIVGVEIDDLLVDAARANLLSVQARRGGVLGNVEVVAADAATYTLPLEPLVIYMYNPFGEQTVRDVAENVQRSWEQCPRPLLVVYYNPVHQHLLDAVPALRRVPSGAEFWSFFRAD
jgi:predicted RNA methylase